MKKKTLKNLQLNKRSISSFNEEKLKGGISLGITCHTFITTTSILCQEPTDSGYYCEMV